MNASYAVSVGARLRGLKSHRYSNEVLFLAPCHDIHTYGMKEAIDVVFVSKDGRVMKSIMNLSPNKRVKCSGAAFVLERFSCADAWPDEGSMIGLRWVNESSG